MRYPAIILLLGLITTSCGVSKEIFGTYSSNFAVNGYHFQQIKLKSDSTLEFKYWGHMIYDTATARFSVNDKTLHLCYYPVQIDTSSWPELRKQGISLMEQQYAGLGKSAPFGLLIRGKKLFLIGNDLGIVKVRPNYKGREKKYFLKKLE
jgi:hypothetical protein